MKHPNETEEEFQERRRSAKENGICVFRDDKDREMILDIIDDYLDLVDAIIRSDGVGEEDGKTNKEGH